MTELVSPSGRTAARLAARILLEVGAVDFRPESPFRHTSGRVSPSYIDCRKLISFPRARSALMDFAATCVKERIGFESIDAIAGGETAGIPFAAWLAERLSLPMLYVRKEAKGFGKGKRIEGVFPPGARVLLVEDLATDAGSKANFVGALRDAGAQVSHALVVFYYGIFPEAEARLKELDIQLLWLASWWDVLAAAREGSAFAPATLDAVEAYLRDPAGWSASKGA